MFLSLLFLSACAWCARESLLAALASLSAWVDGLLSAILRPAAPFACALAGLSLRESRPEGARAWERIDFDPPTPAAPLPPPLSEVARPAPAEPTCPRCGVSAAARADGYLYCQLCVGSGYPADVQGADTVPTPSVPPDVPTASQEKSGEAERASLPLPTPAPSDLYVKDGAKHRAARPSDVGPFFTRTRAKKSAGKRWEYTPATVADVA